MAKQVQDFYKATITQDWSIGTGNFYVSVKPTISEGWLYISPNNSAVREKIYYNGTGTDSNGDYITITERGVGTTDEQTHTIGEPVRMNVGEDFIKYMTDSIDAIVAAGTPNADTSTAGKGQLATPTQVDNGTEFGSTSASLLLTPKNVNDSHNIPSVAPGTSGNVMSSDGTDWISTSDNNKKYTVGALDNALVKTYFNMQFPFILWAGSTNGAATTDFSNWFRENGTRVYVPPMGAMADFQSTTSTYLYLINFLVSGANTKVMFASTNIVIMDWWAKLPTSGTGDISMGFTDSGSVNSYFAAYNASNVNRVIFAFSSTGVLYATISKNAVGVTNTDISSGLTLTNWNNFRIELTLGTNAKFYVNGVLLATLSGVNLPTISNAVAMSFGRSNTALFQVTAPTLSIEMNP